MATRESLKARSERVGECLIWRGGLNPGGYGYVWHEGKNRATHRVSYEMNVGPIPEGLELLHSCDTPSCIEPSHLSPGTHAENMKEMSDRKRCNRPSGEMHSLAKLTEAQVSLIRNRYKPYCRINSSCAIAKELGVSQRTVWAVIKGITWKESHSPASC
ncbi:HNH endonuclease signature motif containing protein [Pseudomonas sp. FH4]|uniref:HNH endonuclease signature motif containing protein n=1 Tax=Pseudomonas sp. FH4 TaxID=1284393 RepID=UPI0009EC78C0|nr:HNH endonuclease signature motif containing protein [Pseudomonas sp. FH4]